MVGEEVMNLVRAGRAVLHPHGNAPAGGMVVAAPGVVGGWGGFGRGLQGQAGVAGDTPHGAVRLATDGVGHHQLGPPGRSPVVGAGETVGHGHSVDRQGGPQPQAPVASRAADPLLYQAGQGEAHRAARYSIDPGGGATTSSVDNAQLR